MVAVAWLRCPALPPVDGHSTASAAGARAAHLRGAGRSSRSVGHHPAVPL